ncbi:MAG: response regulator [Xenococcaceae cyanobacterium MO_167.B27]|nr:response regulator [Xenococcaceae cyanobacterium MO_167.B27]
MISTNSLFDLLSAETSNFTGKVLVQSSKNIEWKLYFLLGKLIWIKGGSHYNRSWLRCLIKFCPEINSEELFVDTKHYYECPQYQTLYSLANRKLISKDCIKSIIETRIKDNFFDILQEHRSKGVKYVLQPNSPSNILSCGFKPSLVMIDCQKIIKISQKYLSFLGKAGLQNISFNHAPKVLDDKQLQQKVDLKTYGNLMNLFNGKLSLRDLSLRLNKDAIKVGLSLAPYLKQGIVKLIEIPDVANNVTPKQYSSQVLRTGTSSPQLTVACIDDSKEVHQMMNKIVIKSGGRLVAIKDEFQVIPSLIEHTPDVIFINIAMPVVNGYELCSQIKRVNKFNQIPIIMLSDNKSISDRMRAKLVGANDFMMKPIKEERVTKIIDKLASDSVNSQPQPTSVLAFS